MAAGRAGSANERVRPDNARLTALIGPEPHTPPDEAVRAGLAGMDWLEAAVVPVAEQGRRMKTA